MTCTVKRIETVSVIVVDGRGRARRYTFETTVGAEEFIRLWLASYPASTATVTWAEPADSHRKKICRKKFG